MGNKENLSESASLFFAAERSAGIIQIVQLDLHRRDGALQVLVLVLFSRDRVWRDSAKWFSHQADGMDPHLQDQVITVRDADRGTGLEYGRPELFHRRRGEKVFD